MNEVCKFTFKEGISKEFIEGHIAEAIKNTEYVFGKAKVRLNAAYLASDNKVIIDASSPVGEHIAEIFTGAMTEAFGELCFTVDRIPKKAGCHEGTTAAIAALTLDQDDVDQPLLAVECTEGSDTTNTCSHYSTSTATKAGTIKIDINGTTRYINFYDDPD